MSVQLLLKTTILQAQSVEVDPNQSGSQSGAESLNVDFEDEGQ